MPTVLLSNARTAGRRWLGAFLLAGLAGCGTAHPTKAPPSYGQRVDAVCLQVHQALAALPKPTSARELSSYLRRGVTLSRPYFGRLEAVRAPAAQTALSRQAVFLSRREVDLTARLADALDRTGNPRLAIRRFAPEFDRVTSAENQSWRMLGAPECGKGATGDSGAGVPS